MQYYGLTLALRDDPAAIERYKDEHRRAWPEVIARLRQTGVAEMRIFLLGRRLFMYLETTDDFDPARDFPRMNDLPRYREWDELMRTMQEKVAEAGPEEWWARMEPVFDLNWPQYRS